MFTDVLKSIDKHTEIVTEVFVVITFILILSNNNANISFEQYVIE